MDVGFLGDSSIALQEVIELSNRNKRLLGMLPYKAFEEAAEEGRIVVAWNQSFLAGYLLFRFSKRTRDVHITQLCVERELRGSGVAEKLFLFLKGFVEDYRVIRLLCREDYKLDEFWAGLGMHCKGEIPGRSGERKPLKLWALKNPNDKVQAELDLFGKGVEQVVIDANVVYDLYANDGSTDSPVLMGDWLKDSYKMCVTPELSVEISRSSDPKRRSDQLRYASSFFSEVDYDTDFYKRAKRHFLSIYGFQDDNKKSDIKHVSYALAANAPYFVTRDEWIRKKGSFQFLGREVLIVRPSELAILHHSEINHEMDFFSERVASDVAVRVIGAEEIDSLKHRFLLRGEKANQLREKIHSSIAVQGSYSGLLTEGGVGRALYLAFPKGEVMAVPILRSDKGANSDIYVSYILTNIVFEAYNKGLLKVEIVDEVAGPYLNHLLSDFGFLKVDDSWVKVLRKGFGGFECVLEYVDDFFKEKFSWPSKNLDLSLKNYIIPIRPRWAKELFDKEYASNDLFGADKDLHLGAKNVYYRSPRGPKLEPFSRVLWYVSEDKKFRGSCSIRACSLIGEVEVGSPAYIYNKYKRFGVYSFKDVEACSDVHGNAMSLLFSHTESFRDGVPLPEIQRVLKSFGHGNFNFPGPLSIEDKVFECLYNIMVRSG